MTITTAISCRKNQHNYIFFFSVMGFKGNYCFQSKKFLAIKFLGTFCYIKNIVDTVEHAG